MALASAPHVDARVPGCPEWTLGDLVAHLGEVQRSWAVGVRAGPADGPPSYDDMDGTSPRDLLEWSAESTRLLIDALRGVGPDASCWTWWGRSDAPSNAGAVARHQVEEALPSTPTTPRRRSASRKPLPVPIALDSSRCDRGSDLVGVLTPKGAKLIPADGAEPAATVSGSASDLILVLIGRVPLERLQIDGDRELVVKLLDRVDTE